MNITAHGTVDFTEYKEGDFTLVVFDLGKKLGLIVNKESYVELDSITLTHSDKEQLRMILISRGVFGPEAVCTASVLSEALTKNNSNTITA